MLTVQAQGVEKMRAYADHPNALSLPTHPSFTQMKGFALSMAKLVLSGDAKTVGGDDGQRLKDQ